jgi:putative transposase
MAIKSYKFRIYPSKRQAQILKEHLAICCELYNAGLQERRDAWRLERKTITFSAQSAQLPEIKRERPDVRAVYSQVLQDVLHRLDKTFQSFFRRVKTKKGRAGFPRFCALARYESLTYPQSGFSIEQRYLKVSNIGNLKIVLHRPVDGAVKTLTIKHEAGRWFAVFVCEINPVPLPFSPNTIGIDLGLATFATLSDGRAIANPRYYREAERTLRVAQRRIERRLKGSNRRRKAIVLLQRTHAHVRAQRADFHHKESRKLADEFGLIAVEDLNVKGLASGMLSKSVHDAGWSSFINKIAYKAENAGRILVKVDPRGTSQTCICGAEVRKMLSQRWHLCLSCGLSADRDHVSAQVILQRAVSLSGANVGALMPCVA